VSETKKPKINVPAALSIFQEPIDDLKAGDKLNALIRQHVFSYKVKPAIDTSSQAETLQHALDMAGGLGDLPRFTDSPSGGMQLFGELQSQGRKVTLQFSGKRWSCWILSEPLSMKPDADASSMLVALGRAALKAAIGHEVYEIPASRTREWKAWMREEIGKVRDNPPSTKVRTRKAAAVKSHVEKLKKVQSEHARALKLEE